MKESSLVKRSFKILKNSPNILACKEVPVLGRCVDIAYFFEVEEELITVEFKLRNWKRALRQAKDHMLAADYAYICMPQRAISETMKFFLEEAGVGLFFYKRESDWPFEEIIKAKKSEETWDVVRQETINYMKSAR
jgi:hypothetical protein